MGNNAETTAAGEVIEAVEDVVKEGAVEEDGALEQGASTLPFRAFVNDSY
jgi:hypothetical protein